MNGAIHKCISRCLSFVCRLSRAPSRFSRLHVDFPSRSSTFTTYRSALSPSPSPSSRSLSLSPPTPRKTILLFLSLHAFLFLFPSLFVAWLLFSLFCFPPLSLFIFPAYPSSPPRCFSSFFPLFPPFRVSFRSCVRSEGGGWVHVAAGITERCFDSCFNGCSAYTRLTRPDAFQFSRNASQHAGSLERSHAPTRENRINCKRRRGYIAHNC